MSLKESLREYARTTGGIVDEYRLQVENAYKNYVGLELVEELSRIRKNEWVLLEVPEKAGIWYDNKITELKKQLSISIEAHNKDLKKLEAAEVDTDKQLKEQQEAFAKQIGYLKQDIMEADLNGYSRGKADAEADKKSAVDLVLYANELLLLKNDELDAEIRKRDEKLESIRKIILDFSMPPNCGGVRCAWWLKELKDLVGIESWPVFGSKKILGEASKHEGSEEA